MINLNGTPSPIHASTTNKSTWGIYCHTVLNGFRIVEWRERKHPLFLWFSSIEFYKNTWAINICVSEFYACLRNQQRQRLIKIHFMFPGYKHSNCCIYRCIKTWCWLALRSYFEWKEPLLFVSTFSIVSSFTNFKVHTNSRDFSSQPTIFQPRTESKW